MFLLPSARFTVETDATPPELVERLEASVERLKFSFNLLWRSKKPLYGRVYPSGFKVARVIRIPFHNMFNPRMHGTLEPRNGGTNVVVKMKLHFFTTVFLLHLILLPGSLFIGGLYQLIRNELADPMYLWIPGAVSALFWVFAHLRFWMAYFPSRHDLEKALRGD